MLRAYLVLFIWSGLENTLTFFPLTVDPSTNSKSLMTYATKYVDIETVLLNTVFTRFSSTTVRSIWAPFEMAFRLLSWTMDILYVDFMFGSSKQGNACRAYVGSNFVALNSLQRKICSVKHSKNRTDTHLIEWREGGKEREIFFKNCNFYFESQFSLQLTQGSVQRWIKEYKRYYPFVVNLIWVYPFYSPC